MKQIIMITLMILFTLGTLVPIWAQEYQISPDITDWLSTKKYEGAKRKYTEGDLNVPAEVTVALAHLGVNHLTILRNEMYARHGYIFKTPVLSAIFSKASWYKPNPAVGINAISSMEAKNVTWIKAIEDVDDFDVLTQFIEERNYTAADRLYSSSSPAGLAPLEIPLRVQLALNHLYINPANLFRNEIFARNGLEFSEGAYKKIFSKTSWYSPASKDQNQIAKKFSKLESINLALLRKWEWIQILNYVKFSLPTGVSSIPVIGFNALFLKEVVKDNGETYYFSWPDAWTAMEEKGGGIDDHITDVEALVDEKTVNAIAAENDPKKKLILFFSSKKYSGYSDKIQYNHSDMKIPSYLEEAVAALDLDWYLLLRKEIHARNGAKFIDAKVGPIFRGCPWYKARYDLNPRTLSRFPSGVTIKSQEISNYSLLEGEELRRRVQAMGDVKGVKIACDLQGNFYFVKTGTVYVAGEESIEIGHAFSTREELEAGGDLQTIVDGLIESFKFDLDQYRQEEAVYGFVGC